MTCSKTYRYCAPRNTHTEFSRVPYERQYLTHYHCYFPKWDNLPVGFENEVRFCTWCSSESCCVQSDCSDVSANLSRDPSNCNGSPAERNPQNSGCRICCCANHLMAPIDQCENRTGLLMRDAIHRAGHHGRLRAEDACEPAALGACKRSRPSGLYFMRQLAVLFRLSKQTKTVLTVSAGMSRASLDRANWPGR